MHDAEGGWSFMTVSGTSCTILNHLARFPIRTFHTYDPGSVSEILKNVYKSIRVTPDKILNMFDAFVGFVSHKVEPESQSEPLSRFAFPYVSSVRSGYQKTTILML